jgi:hypothetical protein
MKITKQLVPDASYVAPGSLSGSTDVYVTHPFDFAFRTSAVHADNDDVNSALNVQHVSDF